MARRYNNNGIFQSWSKIQIIGFWLILLLSVAGAAFLTIPIGLSVFLLVFLLPLTWKDPQDMSNPSLGSMTPGTMPYKMASFFRVMKMENRGHIFSPISMFGFGAPEDDLDKDVRATLLFPPARLSSYWSLGFAIIASFVDYYIHPYVLPIWGESPLPTIISQIISAIFFFATFQSLNVARRYQMAEGLPGVDHTPAVMLNKLPKDGSKKKALIRAILFTVAGSGVVFGIAALYTSVGNTVNWLIVSTIGISLGMSLGTWSAFRVLTEAYRREFNEHIERREFWNDVWAYKKDKAPYYGMEVPVPGKPGKPGGPPEGEPEAEPHVWAATFGFPTNGTFGDYANEVEKLIPSMSQAEMVAISQIPKTDPNTGDKIPGTVSSEGFRVWWTDQNISMHDLLSNQNEITPEQKEIAVRVNIIEPLSKIKGIYRCIVHSHSMMTAPESKVHIMKVNIVPSDNVTEADFTSKIENISSAIGARWVRAKQATDARGRSMIELYVGTDGPNNAGIVYTKGMAESRHRNRLLAIDWEYAFTINGLRSSRGAPTMILSKPVTDVSNELVFDLPPGVDFSAIKKKADTLMTSSGNSFLEMHPGITGKKDFSKREKRQLDKFINSNGSVSQFSAVAAVSHPLDRLFYFKDYMDELITGRELGVAKIEWSPGPKSNGNLAIHSFGKDDPHLVLAGTSGSGKSVLIYSLIAQMAANNDPRDLQIWIIDPKIGYQNFQNMDTVTRYIDSWTPAPGMFFESTRDLFKEAVDEMGRRGKIFRFAKSDEPIDKLSVARKIGLEQGPNPDGSPNELIQPYIFIIVDECAMLFAGAPDKETKELQAEILYYASKLARESRFAGIHCLFATQYPTKESLPSIIKQQSGRIGLATRDQMASKVIIDENGLEELWLKGSGKVLDGKQLFDFRGLLLEDDKNGIHTMMDIINSLPSRDPAQGGVGIAGASQPEYIDIPEADASIFDEWEDSGFKDKMKDSLNEKTKSAMDKLTPEEFDQMDLEDFKAYMRRNS